MENRSIIDQGLLTAAILRAVLSDRSLIEGENLHQMLTEYIKENAEMIATEVISSQLPLNAPQGKQVSTRPNQPAPANANR